jgi:uncharacterized protein YecE (DUF72 family)
LLTFIGMDFGNHRLGLGENTLNNPQYSRSEQQLAQMEEYIPQYSQAYEELWVD